MLLTIHIAARGHQQCLIIIYSTVDLLIDPVSSRLSEYPDHGAGSLGVGKTCQRCAGNTLATCLLLSNSCLKHVGDVLSALIFPLDLFSLFLVMLFVCVSCCLFLLFRSCMSIIRERFDNMCHHLLPPSPVCSVDPLFVQDI
jgi:hypothetical protein